MALFLTGVALAAETPDPAARFLGEWEGPANVYDDTQVLRPTHARLKITRSSEPQPLYVVELTLFDKQLSRFTRCELADAGELRVRDELLVDLRRIKVEGVLRSRDGRRLEEGLIRYFVETPQGDFRPYYAVKLAAKRVEAAPPEKPRTAP
jgi:hypothetical protein